MEACGVCIRTLVSYRGEISVGGCAQWAPRNGTSGWGYGRGRRANGGAVGAGDGNTPMLYITLGGFTLFDCCRSIHLGGSFL